MNRTGLLAVYARQPSPPDLHSVAGAGAPVHRQRRLARAALRLLLTLIGVPEETGGYRFPHRRLSLAHTGEASIAIAAFGPLPVSLAGVGTDLETVRSADPRTARFFLTDAERAWLDQVPPRRRETEHVRLWTVKEALFKSDPANRHAVLTAFRTVDPSALTGCATRSASASARFGYVSGRVAGDDWLTVAACFDPVAPAPAPPVPCPTATRQPRHLEGYTAMSNETVTFERVAQRVSTLLSVPMERITPETTLHDLAADSFRLVETVVDLQEEFDSIFTQAELKQVNTLGELVELLRAPR